MKLTIFETKKETTKTLNENFKVYNNVKITNDFSSIIKLILNQYIKENSLNSLSLKNIETWQKDMANFIKDKTNNHNLFILLAEYSLDNPDLGNKYINFLLRSKFNEKDNSFLVNINLSEKCILQLKILNNYSKNIISNIVSTNILIENKEELNIVKNIENNKITVWYDKDWLVGNNNRESGIDIFLKSINIDENILKQYQKEENDNKINRINLLSKKFNVENNLTNVFVSIIERESFQGNIKLSKKIGEINNSLIYFEYHKETNSFDIIKKTKDDFNNEKNVELLCKGFFINRTNMNISYNKNLKMADIYQLNKIIKNFVDQSQYIYPDFDWTKINNESFSNGKLTWDNFKKSEFNGCYQPNNPLYIPLKDDILNLVKQLKLRKDIEIDLYSNKVLISIDKNNLNIQLNKKNICRFNLNKNVFKKNDLNFFLCNIYYLKDEATISSILNSLSSNNKLNINKIIKNEIIKLNNSLDKGKIIE